MRSSLSNDSCDARLLTSRCHRKKRQSSQSGLLVRNLLNEICYKFPNCGIQKKLLVLKFGIPIVGNFLFSSCFPN